MISDRKEDDNVIHVHFGRNPGRRPAPPVRPQARGRDSAKGADAETGQSPQNGPQGNTDPYSDLFKREEVATLFSIPEGRLRYWDQSGFIKPSGKVGRRRFYTFQDLIGLRAAKELLDRGTPLAAVRRSLAGLQRSLPHVTRPLNELRVSTDGQAVVVHDADRTFDAETGQLKLDFDVRSLRNDVVRVLRPEQIDPQTRQQAYLHYLEGCRLDEDEATFDRAEHAYEKAIELDPELANALTNWGNLAFRRGRTERAKQLYLRALAIDQEQPEAHYNLGFLAFESGRAEQAAQLFSRAAEHDPAFADAHFNLAMALEELGRKEEARPHWKTYLELDPEGSWAEIARRHL